MKRALPFVSIGAGLIVIFATLMLNFSYTSWPIGKTHAFFLPDSIRRWIKRR